ncbi:uncharacterized protein LOC115101629 isoform X3 [Oncorhynchus nerka]
MLASATLIFNIGGPSGVSSQYRFTHNCMAKHESNTIIKFADNTTVVGLITDNDETAYREEVRDLAMWCQDNNLSLNVIKTKEMIVDYRKRKTEHAPILIEGAVVERLRASSSLVYTSTTEKMKKDLAWVLRSSKVVLGRQISVCREKTFDQVESGFFFIFGPLHQQGRRRQFWINYADAPL